MFPESLASFHPRTLKNGLPRGDGDDDGDDGDDNDDDNDDVSQKDGPTTLTPDSFLPFWNTKLPASTPSVIPHRSSYKAWHQSHSPHSYRI